MTNTQQGFMTTDRTEAVMKKFMQQTEDYAHYGDDELEQALLGNRNLLAMNRERMRLMGVDPDKVSQLPV